MVAVYSGTAPIEAHEEAVVVAKVGGEVRQIYVEEGDAVQPGQLLARLDGDRLRLTLAQTDANLRKLERDYKRTLELAEKGLVPKSTAENTEVRSRRAARQPTPARSSNSTTRRSARRSRASSRCATSRSATPSCRMIRPSR
jgi:membrane fusion protein, multidrug efflux system